MEKKASIIWKSAVLLGIFIIAFALAKFVPESDTLLGLVQDYGYIGIFIIALVSGFNLAVPVPAVAFMPLFLEAGLSFPVAIAVLTLGVTIADSVAFFLGRAGKHLITESFGKKVFITLENLRERYPRSPLIILFIYACIAPLPNELVVIPLALFGYRYRHVAPVLLVGNLAFSILYALGIISFFNIL